MTCPSALRPVIARVLEEHPLLPASVSGGVANAELAAIEVRAPDGAALFRFGPGADPGYAGDPVASSGGAPVFRAALPAAIAGRLIVTRPRSRLPLLFGLLALTAGLAAVAARQLRREQELARLRADFTSSVSHELRTPLTQILLFAETLELGRAGGDAERRQALGIIVQEARRLAHLVENILQFSRAERRMLQIRTAEQPLAPLIRETAERFAPLAAGCALVHHRSRRAAGRAGARRFGAADRHQPAGQRGEVRRRRAPSRSGAHWATAAHGSRWRMPAPGSPPEDRVRVWEPFVRLGSVAGGRRERDRTGRGARAGDGARRRLLDGSAVPTGGTRVVVELPGGRRAAPAEAA